MGREGEEYKYGCWGGWTPGCGTAGGGGGGTRVLDEEPENILAGNLRGNVGSAPMLLPAAAGWWYPAGVIGWQHLQKQTTIINVIIQFVYYHKEEKKVQFIKGREIKHIYPRWGGGGAARLSLLKTSWRALLSVSVSLSGDHSDPTHKLNQIKSHNIYKYNIKYKSTWLLIDPARISTNETQMIKSNHDFLFLDLFEMTKTLHG